MAEFVYEAMTAGGQRNKGSLTATTEREVMAMLDARGLFPLRIAPSTSTSAKAVRFGGKVRARHVATFFSQLADLLHSGVPMLRSLEILERQTTQPALAGVLKEVRARVTDGTGLAEALSQHPAAFNELSVSMVRAGQEGGFLEDVLRRIADFTEHQEDLKSRVVGALAYPVFLAVAGFVVLNILIIFFVPRFEPIFKKLDEKGELPALTKVLVAVSHGMQRMGIPVLVLLGAVALLWVIKFSMSSSQSGLMEMFGVFRFGIFGLKFLAYFILCPSTWRMTFGEAVVFVALIAGLVWFFFWSRSEKGRYTLDDVRLRIPTAGTIYLSFALSRFTRILSTMLHNGIPILNALRISKDSTGNKVLSQAIDEVANSITEGKSLAAPLSNCKYFPRDVVEMISVGEESNSLEKVLMDISTSLEKRTSRQLDLFVRLLEPIMLLVMALITLTVVAGLLLPVFKMSSAVK